MTATLVRSRALAFYLAVSLLILTPFQGFGKVQAEVGVKTVVLGAAVGGAALFALKAMLGPASIVGSLGAAGTGAVSAVGRMAGAAMSGISSLASTIATGATTLFSSLGSFLSTGLRGAASLVTQPWFYIPAALIGGGLLVYHFYNKSKGASGGASPGILSRAGGFFDRMRASSAARRQLYTSAYAAQGYSSAYYGGMSNFYTGGPAPFQNPNSGYLGGFGAPVAPPATVLGDSAAPPPVVTNDLRASLRPSETANPAQLQADLARAEEARKGAYQKLKDALLTTGQSPAAPRSISNDPVIDAIRAYKDASRQVEAIKEKAAASR